MRKLFASLLMLLVATVSYAAPGNIYIHEMGNAVTTGTKTMDNASTATIDLNAVLGATPTVNAPVVLKVTVMDDLSSVTLDKLNVLESSSATVSATGLTLAKTGLIVKEGEEIYIRVKKRYLHLGAVSGPVGFYIVRVQ